MNSTKNNIRIAEAATGLEVYSLAHGKNYLNEEPTVEYNSNCMSLIKLEKISLNTYSKWEDEQYAEENLIESKEYSNVYVFSAHGDRAYSARGQAQDFLKSYLDANPKKYAKEIEEQELQIKDLKNVEDQELVVWGRDYNNMVRVYKVNEILNQLREAIGTEPLIILNTCNYSSVDLQTSHNNVIYGHGLISDLGDPNLEKLGALQWIHIPAER